jgi:hypothetical protein
MMVRMASQRDLPAQLLLLAARSARTRETARTLRWLVVILLLAERLAAAQGRGKAPRRVGRARSAAVPRRTSRAGRGSVSGRRPRG